MCESSSSLQSPRAAKQCSALQAKLGSRSNKQRLEFSKAFHTYFCSLLVWLLALVGSRHFNHFQERMLVAIGLMSISYIGAHFWIIQRTVDRSSLHCKSNFVIVLAASIIFGMLIYLTMESQSKWFVIGSFTCVVPATNPYLLQLVLERTSKIWKHVVGVSFWAFDQLHDEFNRFWIARRTTLSTEREVSGNQEVGHDECDFGDELV